MSHRVAQVFDTYELLEKILMELPPGQLFVNQRVCKSWLGIFKRSKGIRPLCFLEPADDAVSPGSCFDYGNMPLKLNPLLHFDVNPPAYSDRFTYDISFTFKAGEDLHPGCFNRDVFLTQPPCTTVDVVATMLHYQPVHPFSGFKRVGAEPEVEEICLTDGPQDLYHAGNGLRVGDLVSWVGERALAATGKESAVIKFYASIRTEEELEC